MKILNCRPAPAGGNTVAHVDVEIIDGVKLFGLRVARMPDASFRVHGPNAERGRAMAFGPAMVDAIARATISFNLDEHSQNDRTSAS